MAKTLKEAVLNDPKGAGQTPDRVAFKGIDPDVHLGYRKGRRGGVWLVRWRNGVGYKQAPLGTADDEIGEGNLDFNAAVRNAPSLRRCETEAKAAADGPPFPVRGAVETYIAERDARETKRRVWIPALTPAAV